MFIWLNKAFIVCFAVLAAVWVSQLNTLAVAMGVVAIVTAIAMAFRPRWAYFVAAAWCFGMLRFAMDRENLLHAVFADGIKRGLMLFYFAGIVVSLVLHEKVAKKPQKDSDNAPPP